MRTRALRGAGQAQSLLLALDRTGSRDHDEAAGPENGTTDPHLGRLPAVGAGSAGELIGFFLGIGIVHRDVLPVSATPFQKWNSSRLSGRLRPNATLRNAYPASACQGSRDPGTGR